MNAPSPSIDTAGLVADADAVINEWIVAENTGVVPRITPAASVMLRMKAELVRLAAALETLQAERDEARETIDVDGPLAREWSEKMSGLSRIEWLEAELTTLRNRAEEAEKALANTLDDITKHGADMAKSYTLGSPESRAIVSTVEHIRIMLRAALQPKGEEG